MIRLLLERLASTGRFLGRSLLRLQLMLQELSEVALGLVGWQGADADSL